MINIVEPTRFCVEETIVGRSDDSVVHNDDSWILWDSYCVLEARSRRHQV